MRRVWRKVKSNSGASMLFALLVFMLCVLAGTAALTAAAANSGRYTHMEAEQQDYLSVASAARVVKDELVKGTFTANFSAVTYSATSSLNGCTPSGPKCTGIFGAVFKDYFTYIYRTHGWKNTGDSTIEGWFTANFSSGTYGVDGFPTKRLEIDNVDGMTDLKLDMDADGSFTIKATLYAGDNTAKRNETVIELVGDPTWTEDTKTENYYYVSGAVAGSPTYSVGTKTTVVRNLSVKWTLENATVYDGGRKK